MLIHASCAARADVGVLIRGRPGSGKSNLLLRLLGRGFELVADDCVLLEGGIARAPDRLRGLIEVRGLGIYRRPYRESARIRLVVEDGKPDHRIAESRMCRTSLVPAIGLHLMAASAVEVVELAVACMLGDVQQVAGPL